MKKLSLLTILAFFCFATFAFAEGELNLWTWEGYAPDELVKQFDGIADVMKRMSSMGARERMRTMQEMTQGSMMNPGGKLSKKKVGTGKRLTPQERAKIKKLREREMRRKKRKSRQK